MSHQVLLSLLCCLCIVLGLVCSVEVEVELDIPWPSGIVIDPVRNPHTGETYRFGRLQHNAVQFRPQWTTIHVVEQVFSRAESQQVIADTEAHALQHGWSKGRHIDYGIRPTKDLPLRTVYPSDDAYQWIHDRFHNLLLPKFHEIFGIDSGLLRIDDLFVTKYVSNSTTENSLAPHQDKSPWSFVIGLNDDFEGGGTFFVEHRKLWRPPAGSAVIFAGKQPHGAYPIKTSDRYILAGFCDYGIIDGIGEEAHRQFLTLYDATFDGHAAASGFRTGDQIIGIETCRLDDSTGTIVRQMTPIAGHTSDADWVHAAQSCEVLTPGENTKLTVKRFVRE